MVKESLTKKLLNPYLIIAMILFILSLYETTTCINLGCLGAIGLLIISVVVLLFTFVMIRYKESFEKHNVVVNNILKILFIYGGSVIVVLLIFYILEMLG